MASFALNVVSAHLTATNADIGTANIDTANIKHLCVAKSDGFNVCVTGDQLAAVLSGVTGTSVAEEDTSSVSSTPDTTPPVIQINGNNPAYINVGDSYADLGATVTGPSDDLNLGIKTFLNGTLVSDIVLDTSAVATDTIDYVVTDQSGLTSTSTRSVIIEAQAPPAPPTSSATTSAATSTSQ